MRRSPVFCTMRAAACPPSPTRRRRAAHCCRVGSGVARWWSSNTIHRTTWSPCAMALSSTTTLTAMVSGSMAICTCSGMPPRRGGGAPSAAGASPLDAHRPDPPGRHLARCARPARWAVHGEPMGHRRSLVRCSRHDGVRPSFRNGRGRGTRTLVPLVDGLRAPLPAADPRPARAARQAPGPPIKPGACTGRSAAGGIEPRAYRLGRRSGCSGSRSDPAWRVSGRRLRPFRRLTSNPSTTNGAPTAPRLHR